MTPKPKSSVLRISSMRYHEEILCQRTACSRARARARWYWQRHPNVKWHLSQSPLCFVFGPCVAVNEFYVKGQPARGRGDIVKDILTPKDIEANMVCEGTCNRPVRIRSLCHTRLLSVRVAIGVVCCSLPWSCLRGWYRCEFATCWGSWRQPTR